MNIPTSYAIMLVDITVKNSGGILGFFYSDLKFEYITDLKIQILRLTTALLGLN